jgi:hypothetical protein
LTTMDLMSSTMDSSATSTRQATLAHSFPVAQSPHPVATTPSFASTAEPPPLLAPSFAPGAAQQPPPPVSYGNNRNTPCPSYRSTVYAPVVVVPGPSRPLPQPNLPHSRLLHQPCQLLRSPG